MIGECADLGSHTFEKDEIVAFAREFDPQPFHLDEAAAKSSLFGALCASGWHTAAHYIRLSVALAPGDRGQDPAAGGTSPSTGPSPGFKNVRWLKPVYVGDTITYRNRTTEKIDLKSRPERGLSSPRRRAATRRARSCSRSTARSWPSGARRIGRYKQNAVMAGR